MVCSRCLKEYDDGLTFCPFCGAKDGQNAAADSSDKLFSKKEAASGDGNEAPLTQEKPVWEDKSFKVVISDEKLKTDGLGLGMPEYPSEIQVRNKEGEQANKNEDEPASGKRKKKEKFKLEKPTAYEKKNLFKLVAVLCVVFMSVAALLFVSMKTDIFSQSQSGSKAVAFSGLTESEKLVLEAQLSKSFSALVKDFDSNTQTTEQFISLINPADSGNFYNCLSGQTLTVETTADPALRFSDAYGNYSYYKLPEAYAESLSKQLGVELIHELNTESGYYYDGCYYLAHSAESKTTPAVTATINDSKAVIDGSFYINCTFYAASGKSLTKYIVVKKHEDEQKAVTFTIDKVSSEPLFTDSGEAVEHSGLGGFEMKTETIDCRTIDGTLYKVYTVAYPVFSGKSEGEVKANKFFTDMLAVYKLNASSIDADYEKFISDGGKKEDLPFKQTSLTKVTLNDSERLSFVETIYEHSPELPVKEAETTTEEDDYDDWGYYEETEPSEPTEPEIEAVKLPETRVEAYTFDKQTGEFVLKDAVLGKNYLVISETLYRIYNGYDYSSVVEDLEQETTAVDSYDDYYDNYGYDYYDYGYDDYYGEESYDETGSIPEDTEELGVAIYESAWALTQSGVSFYYVTGEGFVKEVTIPLTEVERLLSQQEQAAASAAVSEQSTAAYDASESFSDYDVTDVTEFEESYY